MEEDPPQVQALAKQPENPWDTLSMKMTMATGSLLTSACHFIPIPILDGILIKRIHRHLARSILKTHGHDPDLIRYYSPVYGGTGSCLGNSIWFIVTFPFKFAWGLITKAFRMVLFIFLIRRCALQIGETLLLGRTMSRTLHDGRLPVADPSNEKSIQQASIKATQIRESYNEAIKGTDIRFLKQIFAKIFRHTKAMRNLAGSLFKVFRPRKGRENTLDEDLENIEGKKATFVEKASAHIASIMGQPEMEAFFNEFDDKFDTLVEKKSKGN